MLCPGVSLPTLGILFFVLQAFWAVTAPPVLAQDTAKSPIVVMGDQDYPPYESLVDGEPVGINVELWREIGRVLGRPVELRLYQWADSQARVRRGEAKVLTFMSVNKERQELYDFTQPTFAAVFPYFVVARTADQFDVSDLTGKRIAVKRGGGPESVLATVQAEAVLVFVDNALEGFQKLLRGEVDAVVEEERVGYTILRENNLKGIRVASDPLAVKAGRIAVVKGNPALLRQIDDALGTLKASGTFDQILDNWADEGLVHVSTETLKFIVVSGLAVIILMVGVGGALYVSRMRKVNFALKAEIDDRKRVGELLRDSEERFRAVVDHSPTKIHIKDAKGRYTLINREAEKLFGVTDEEGWGKTSDDIFPKHVADSFTDHDRAVLETGRSIEAEEEWVCDDGVHTYLTVKFPILGSTGEIVAVGAIGTDITDRKRVEERIRDLANFPEQNPDPVLRFAVDGTLLYANPRSEPLLKDLKCGTGESAPEHWRRMFAEVLETRSPKEFEYECGGLTLSLLLSPVPEAGYVYMYGRDITERKQAEEALRESEGRLSAIFSHVFDAIITIGSHGIVEGFNPAAERLFGYDAAEVVGKNLSMLMTEPNRSEHDGYLKRYLETGKGPVVCCGREVKGKRKNGSVFPADLEVTRMEVGGQITFIGTLRDITERKRAEEALRESEERFKDVAEAASDWFWEMDENLRFTFFSDRRQQLTGLAPEDNIGKTRWQVADADPDNDEKWRQHRAVLEAHEPFRDFEYTFIRKDSKTVHNKVSGRPVFDANGAFKGYRGAATDVTEQIEAQAQLIQAAKLATLGEMASGIAHELNQPLSVVGMAAELSLMSMEESAFDTEFVRKKLQTVVRQKERMAEIINHMRLFSRRDTTGMELFNPVECVAGAVGLVDQQFRTSGIELKLNLPAACRNVFGHPFQLEQVVLNLLNNARDAILGAMGSAGSGQSHPAPKMRISLVDDKRRKSVVISVADNGGGIPEQALERIFDPFFTTKKEGQGTGLGLSISYSIVDAMGGRLEAKNTDGGAMFRITLPVSADEPAAVDSPPKRRRATPRPGKPGSTRPRILFVDDEKDIVEEVAEYLVYEGYDVATAGNGLEALELHRSRPADMVITDWLMPGMGGDELIRRLRRTHPDLPIMVITGHTTFGEDQDIVTHGASVVLKKPIDLHELSQRMRQMVGHSYQGVLNNIGIVPPDGNGGGKGAAARVSRRYPRC